MSNEQEGVVLRSNEEPKRENPQPRLSSAKEVEKSLFELEGKIIKAYLNGNTTIAGLVAATGAEASFVKAIIQGGRLPQKAEVLNQAVTKELFAEKIPKLKSVVGLTVSIAEEYLTKLSRDKGRLHSLTTAEVRDLTAIGKNWNEVLRLDLGEATSIEQVKVVHSLEATENIFTKLKQIDPVFEYPTIDVTEESRAIGAGESADSVSRGGDDEDI